MLPNCKYIARNRALQTCYAWQHPESKPLATAVRVIFQSAGEGREAGTARRDVLGANAGL